MSYLDGPRITFAGRFLGDVPTINNDPAAFEPPPTTTNPAWNPDGGGTFDFLGCHIDGGETAPGTSVPEGDPALGLAVVGAADRSSAKLVDLDPDWQSSSQIWGLTVRVVDPVTGEELVSGSFRPTAFRDSWRRQVDNWPANAPPVNRMPITASFTSVLDDVAFGPGCRNHPVLDALRLATPTPRLSIVLNVFGFFYSHLEDRFATGSLTGCIGPWLPGEPLSFVAGRRLDMGRLTGPTAPVALQFGRSVAAVTRDRSHLVVDLANAYPIRDYQGKPFPMASVDPNVEALEIGVLPTENVVVGSPVPAVPAPTILGSIELEPQPPPAGIFSFPLESEAALAVAQGPLAVLARLADGRRRVVSREPRGGLYVRADEFVHRIDAGNCATTTVHAVRRGEPVTDLPIFLLSRAGTTSVLSVPHRVVTGAGGTATVPMTAADPRNQRGGVDGAVETVGYSPKLAADGRTPDYTDTGLDQGVDVIVAHVRDAYWEPPEPEWERDVQPLLDQYARLYPIMGRHLVDLGDRDAIRRYRAAIEFAMSREITDPNYMPVTRDLSGPKRATIRRWLARLSAEPGGMARPVAPPGPRPIARDAKTEVAEAVGRRAMAHQDADGAGPDAEHG